MTVTAILPCYNAEAFISQAIESVLEQSRVADEVIVVDDCSTDASREFIKRYPVRLLQTPMNSGHASARNIGIRASKGEIIAWLDADDFWHPQHLEIVVGLLERHPTADVAFSGIRHFGKDEGVWSDFPCSGEVKKLTRECFRNTVVPALTAVTRKSALEAVGGFDENIRIAPDFDLWLRMSLSSRFISTDIITASYRRHAMQISAMPNRQLASVWQSRTRFIEALYARGECSLAGELKDLGREIWETDANYLWSKADLKELRHHLTSKHFLPRDAAVVRRFRRRSALPGMLVAVWQIILRIQSKGRRVLLRAGRGLEGAA